MGEWKKYKLKDVCTILGDGLHGTPIYDDKGEFFFINGNNLKDGRISIKNDTKRVPYSEANKYKKPLNNRTILVSINGTIGNVAKYQDEKCILGKSACFFNVKENVDLNFIYYVVANQQFKNTITQLATGTTIKNVSLETMRNYTFGIPPLSIQKQIGKILSSFDEKIELNRRINDNLEQQAQALFKSWFVDFEPFLREEFFKSDSLFGDIPVEWHIVAIKDLSVYITDYVANGSFASLRENVRLYDKPNYAHFIRNTDLKAESYKMYVDKHSYEFLSKSVLEGGEIIISNVGDVGSVFLCPKLEKPMTLGNNIILLRPKKDYLTFYLYMLFKGGIGQHLIDGVTGGSAQRKFNKTDFKSIKLMMPPVNILIKFDRIVKPIFSKIEENRDEISRLTSLRDTLLPKLMSGELKINDINN